jgi:MSHA biogenesis protein MshO
MLTRRYPQSGFTLVEMIMVIVITGIIGGMVAVFIQAPVQGYISSEHRAELTDIADTAMRRMARDIRTSVPNSVHQPTACTTSCVEFLPTKDGGMYRVLGSGNALTFGPGGSNTFDILGASITFADPLGVSPDYIVIGSTQSSGTPPYDTSGVLVGNGVLRKYTGAAGVQSTVTFTNLALPTWAALSSQRFDVVDGTQQAVTYVCVGPGGAACPTGSIDTSGNGTCQLMRYWKYGFASAYTTGQSAILADKVSTCTISYQAANQRYGLLTTLLTLTSSNESATLYNEIHVNNAP